MTAGRAVLSVDGLTIEADAGRGRPLVRDVSFSLDEGECFGLVGESGSGKSLTLRSIIGLLPRGVTATAGDFMIAAAGDDLTPYRPRAIERGRKIAMIFQEPMTALNPVFRVSRTVTEPLRQHFKMPRKEAFARAGELLDEVGIKEPGRVLRSYPHELSGGQRQRVAIAAALACEPGILLCDEPTTALDVTTQAQIISLLRDLMTSRGMSLVFVSHDLGVLSEIASEVCVMYAGEIVESGSTDDVLLVPTHPYTDVLMRCVPSVREAVGPLASIPGFTPAVTDQLSGCAFSARCHVARSTCHEDHPVLATVRPGHRSRCLFASEWAGEAS